MRNSITIIFLCCLFNAGAQVSVFNCSAHPVVTPAMISAGPEFFQPCIVTDQAQVYNYNGTSSKKLTAATSINIKPGFHAGAYTNTTGKMWLKMDNPSAFDVAVMNYPDLKNVLKFEKLELGIKMPTDIMTKIGNFLNQMMPELNPFKESNLKVQTTFTHLQTMTEKKIDGFFYRDFNRGSGSWTDKATEHSFRIRFAPPLNGMWLAKVKIIVNGTLHSESASFTFNVVESGNPGYVTVHENNRNLQLGDELIYPVGQNFWWPDRYGTWKSGPARGTPQHWIDYLAEISDYADMGGKYIRASMHPYSMDIEWEKLGNYYDRMDYAWEIDHLLELCEEKNINVEFTMRWHNVFQKIADYGQFRWDFDTWQPTGLTEPSGNVPYCYKTIPGVTEPQHLLTNTVALDYQKQRTRYLISRYGYSTSIYMLELANEVFHIGETSEYVFADSNDDGINDEVQAIANSEIKPYRTDIATRAAIYNYHTQISEYIKNTLQHSEHLISVDYGTNECLPNFPWGTPETDIGDGGYPDYSFLLPTVDVVGFNAYGKDPDKYRKFTQNYVEHNDDPEKKNFSEVISDMHINFGKPVFLSEIGHGDGVDPCNNWNSAYIDLMCAPFMGLAGLNMWHTIDIPTTWDEVVRAQDHMNASQDLRIILDSDWRLFGDKKDLKEYHAYVSEDQEKAAGYVRNRSFNYHTIRTPGNQYCDAPVDLDFDPFETLDNNEDDLDIEGLKSNTDYRIYFYGYANGNYLGYEDFNTSASGKHRINHSPLNMTNPAQWFVIEQYNHSKPGKLTAGIDGYTSDGSEQSLTVVPNPFKEEILLTSKTVIGEIVITDIRGNVIRRETINQNSDILELEELANGIYLIQVISTGEVVRIVKQ